jgi:hypothetical protein
LLVKSPEHNPPVAASGQASKLSADHVLSISFSSDRSADLLQFAILFLELTQSRFVLEFGVIAISGILRVPSQAARSIGSAMGFCGKRLPTVNLAHVDLS